MTRFKFVIYGSIVAFFFFLISVNIPSKIGNINSSRDMSTDSKGIEGFARSNSNQIVLAQLHDELKQLKAQASIQAHTLNDLRQLSSDKSARLAAIESTEDLIISSQDETQLVQDLSGQQSNELDLEQLKQAELKHAEHMLYTLDNEISNEPYDERWAPEMQETIAATLQNQNFRESELVTVTCQSNLCRIDVEHDNADAENEFLHNFVPAAGYTDTEVFFSRSEEPDGRSVMTYYISRDGQQMPSLEEF